MNRSAFYVATFFVVLGSLLLSFYFLPSHKEMAYSYLDSRQYGKAFKKYTTLFDEGDHSISITVPYVKAQMEVVGAEGAIEIMLSYLKKHPHEEAAWDYLGKLYKEAGQFGEYLQNLKNRAHLFPSAKIYEEMADLADLYEEYPTQKEALEMLVFNYQARFERYQKLALIYAKDGELSDVEKIIDRLVQVKLWGKAPARGANLFLELLLRAGKKERSIQFAEDYLQGQNSQTAITQTLQPFISRGEHELALSLLSKAPFSPALIPVKNQLLRDSGRDQEAYNWLRFLWARNKLPDTQLASLYNLSLGEEDFETARLLLSKLSLEDFEKKLLVDTALFVARYDQPLFAEDMLKWLHKQPETDISFLIDLFELSKLHVAVDEKELPDIQFNSTKISNEQRGYIAQILQIKGYKNAAKEHLSQILSIEQVSSAVLYSWVELFKDLEAWDVLQNDPREEMRLLEKLAVGEEVLYIPESLMRDEAFLYALVPLALKAKKPVIALSSAQSLYHLSMKTEVAGFLAQALAMNGEMTQAFALLKQLEAKGKNVSEAELLVLIEASLQDKSYTKQLNTEIQKQLTKFPENARLLQSVAYTLLQKEFHNEAEKIYLKLAAEKPFAHPDMQSLLFIWGEAPTEKEIHWIIDQAKQSKKREKWGWISHLTYVGYPEEAIQLVDKKDLDDEKLTDAYLEALVLAKQKQELEGVLAFVYQDEERPDRLKRLGKRAQEGTLYRVAEEIYHKVLAKDPEDLSVQKELGILAFEQGHYRKASCYLSRCLGTEIEDALVLYILGEIYWTFDKRWCARDFYWAALCKIPKEDEEVATRLIEAHSLFRLGCFSRSIAVFCNILQKKEDSYVRAAFAQVLIDLGQYQKAAWILSKASKEKEEGRSSIATAQIRNLQERGCLCRALQCVSRALSNWPEETDVYGTAASVEFVYGRWQRSLCYLRKALCLSPCHEGYLRTWNEAVKDHRPYLSTTWEEKKTGSDQRETFWKFHQRACLSPFVNLFVAYEMDEVSVAAYTAPKTGTVSSRTATENRAEVTLTHEGLSGTHFEGSILWADGIIGGAISSRVLDAWGSWMGAVEYHKPNWEFIQGVIDQGSRDMVRIQRSQRILPGFVVEVEAGYREYNLNDLPRQATSLAFIGGLIYTFPALTFSERLFGDGAELSVGYLFDAEYVTSIKTRLDPLNNPYQPMPLSSREMHTPTLFVAKKILCNTRAEGNIGFSYDQKTKKGGIVGAAAVIFGKKPGFEGRVEYSHSVGTDVQTSEVNRTIIEVRYTY